MGDDSSVLLSSDLPLPSFRHGKVRDVYDLGNKLLIVSTDRISAFDVVLPCGIPGKGRVLTSLSAFWFERTAPILPNHVLNLIDSDAALEEVNRLSGLDQDLPACLIGRSMLVTKADRIPAECIVRGYLSGSAWAEYKETGKIGSIRLPSGMEESQEFTAPVFTPTTKNDSGHDRLLTDGDIQDLGIKDIYQELKEKSLRVYRYARDYARERGIIIADTKFEFGFIGGRLALIDELLTPDSSRFWDAERYQVGRSQPSFDKQPVRDWLLGSGWDRRPPAPTLPAEVIEGTARRYRDVYRRLTGSDA
jgi:phosphoribosylaminoimidazole-succinocarboxamide synthase